MDIQAYLKKETRGIERALEGCLPKPEGPAKRLHKAMRYAVSGGGKRIRPVLALAACRAVGGNIRRVLPAACAIELIHSYSLVHDDLPCMDNDRLRRGRPSCHIQFGEYTAVLAGDALLTLAFEVLSKPNASGGRQLQALNLVAQAAGLRGMAGGQAVDMEYKGKEPDLPKLDYIHAHKSGDLIEVSAKIGGLLGGGTDAEWQALGRYGKRVGLLFQITDDILDGEGYAKITGVLKARKKAGRLFEEARAELSRFGKKGLVLEALARWVLTRVS